MHQNYTFTDGDILTSNCEVIVCPVNCKGAMGAGLAKSVAMAYPEVRTEYKNLCAFGLKPGEVVICRAVYHPYAIWVAATKAHYINNSEIEWVQNCLYNISSLCRINRIKSIAVPALGCGCGGLAWADVYYILLSCAHLTPNTDFTFYRPQ